MTDLDLDRIEAAARAALGGSGGWSYTHGRRERVRIWADDDATRPMFTESGLDDWDHPHNIAVGAHIALMDPATTLDLVGDGSLS